jgi:hypothetical protein
MMRPKVNRGRRTSPQRSAVVSDAARRSAGILPIMVLIVAACAGSPSGASESESADVRSASVASIAEAPMTYVGKTVEVTGQLTNIGTDYFTDLQVALRDQHGNAVYVIPWLPLAYPPMPPGAARERPPALSDYLDKHVKLTGMLERTDLKGVGEVYALRVGSAEKIP